MPGGCADGVGNKIGTKADYSTDSLNLVSERDECWLLEAMTAGVEEDEDDAGASQLLCRTNMTNYTLAWSSSASGTDQDIDFNEPGKMTNDKSFLN